MLMQFYTLGSSKIEVLETHFIHILIRSNDHPRYVKHVLGHIYVFFTLFAYWVQEGGVPQVIGTQRAWAVFQPRQLKNRSFRSFFLHTTIT